MSVTLLQQNVVSELAIMVDMISRTVADRNTTSKLTFLVKKNGAEASQ